MVGTPSMTTNPPSPKNTPETAFHLVFKPVSNGLVVTINGDLLVAKNLDEALTLARTQMYQQLTLTQPKE